MDYVHSVWSYLASICNCWQCTEDPGAQPNEPNERTHLLVDPVNHSPALRRSNSDGLSTDYAHSLPKKDDQNALSRLVQNTAINMINVGAMDCHSLEHQEYADRIRLYSQRLHQQWNNGQHASIAPKGLLKDVPSHQFYLSKPIHPDDTAQIKLFTEKAHISVSAIQIDHKEAVVVPFRIP
ncbi:uncharacterized protein LOC6738783 [Drosophila simulans]|uniref:Ragulator complex protein LAMTOR1 n=1 Tax=Drosophila simulans TaxID=7240 RepID=B4QRF5_DROSI|nr:uncharacterized protein LOC6738783 [Drosophila simulans]EDX11168.1 GD12229 [Drosophila simulans]KMZ00681.1 uncharacterized protein Dsimw501_GD12229 [Drosophila simulans]